MQIIKHKDHRELIRQNCGFTIVELAIVMVIMGFLMAGLLNGYRTWDGFVEIQKYDESSESLHETINRFYSEFSRYPCPADPTLTDGDANYGVENCAMVAVNGAQDTDFDVNTTPDPILVGILPSSVYANTDGTATPADLTGLKDFLPTNTIFSNGIHDPSGQNIIYAVTFSQTNAATYDADYGAIKIVDEEDRDTGGTNDDAHFVIILRADRASCPVSSLTVPTFEADGMTPFTGLFDPETENCDGDFKFVDALRDERDGGFHYDDYITYKIAENSGMWGLVDGETYVRNKNTGKVSVGDTYEEVTDVDLRLDIDGNLKSNRNIRADLFCDSDTGSCFAPESLYDFNCANDGEYATGTTLVGGNLVVTCEPLDFSSDASCGNGKYMKGVFTDGMIDCTPD